MDLELKSLALLELLHVGYLVAADEGVDCVDELGESSPVPPLMLLGVFTAADDEDRGCDKSMSDGVEGT